MRNKKLLQSVISGLMCAAMVIPMSVSFATSVQKAEPIETIEKVKDVEKSEELTENQKVVTETIDNQVRTKASAASDFVVKGSVITGYKGKGGGIVIPAKINGVTITEIGDRAFPGWEGYASKITSVAFEQGSAVKKIATYAFDDCKSISTVKLPSKLTTIGDGAFSGCSNLSSITVPADNTSFIVQDGVLYNKSKSSLILYPAKKAGNLFNIPATVSEIKPNAFLQAKNLKSINIGNSVKKIAEGAFAYCTNLTSLVIPDSVTDMDITNEDTYGIFQGCSSLKTLKLPTKLKDGSKMYGYFFEDCKALESLIIPEGVVELHRNSLGGPFPIFQGCKALKSVTFPKTLKRIDWNYVFSNDSTALRTIIFKGDAITKTTYDNDWDNESLRWDNLTNITFYYYPTSKGFTTPKWMGHPCYPISQLPAELNVKLNTSIVNKNPIPGGSIVSRAVVSGDAKGLQYKFVWSYNNWQKWGVIKNFSTANTVNWNLPANLQGNFDIYVDVKDSTGRVVSKSNKIKIGLGEASKASISKQTIKLGESVVINANSTGKNPQYKFVWSRNNWSAWGVTRNFSAVNKTSFKPNKVGKYHIYVDIKDKNGNLTTKVVSVNVVK